MARIVTRSDVGEGREMSTAFCRAARCLKVRDDWGLPGSSSGVPSWIPGRSSGVGRLRFRKFMTVPSPSTDGVFRLRRRRELSVMSPSEAGGFASAKRAPLAVCISEATAAPASEVWVSAMTAEASLAFDMASSCRSSSSSTAHSGHFHLEGATNANTISKQ